MFHWVTLSVQGDFFVPHVFKATHKLTPRRKQSELFQHERAEVECWKKKANKFLTLHVNVIQK